MVLILAIVLIAIPAFVFMLRPVATVIYFQRRELRRAGMRRIAIAGPRGRLVYWKGGSGPLTFLLHGVNDHAGSWSGVVRDLLRDATLIIPDFPGHGDSEPRSGPLDLDDILRGLDAIMEVEAPVMPVRLVGNSMGGWVALRFALDHPDRVAALVLESPGGLTYEYKLSSFLPRNRSDAMAMVTAVYGPALPKPAGFVLDDMVRRAPRMPAVRILQKSLNDYALDANVGNIRVPTTLVWGELDGVLPLDYGRRLESMVPNAHLDVLRGAAHIPHRTHPKAFAEAVSRALANGRQ
jgi:pimeloyl-ACP methyl ester carboxylesterase